MFPKNTWYVACTPDDMADKPLGRQICGERMVFYRNADGQASALEDFCPHRGAPLSLGRVCKGQLVCGYHGLEMGCDGRTRSMPGQKVERFAAIRSACSRLSARRIRVPESWRMKRQSAVVLDG